MYTLQQRIARSRKKRIHRKLIKLQNQYGKVLGKTAWMKWKDETLQ